MDLEQSVVRVNYYSNVRCCIEVGIYLFYNICPRLM